MPFEDNPLLGAAGALAPLLVALAIWLILRRRKKNFQALLTWLSCLYGLALSVYLFVSYSLHGSNIILWPLSLLFNVAVAMIGVLLAARLFPQHIFTPGAAKTVPDYSSPALLREAVTNILDSDKFLTALRSTLPKGEEDKRHGLDFIPYILSSIDERRERALKSARYFLLATAASALIFSGVVMYFGYILVNEASAGSAKHLSDIKSAMDSTSSALNTLLPSYYNNPVFKRDVAPRLETLERTDAGPRNQETRGKVAAVIAEARRTGDFASLSSALTAARAEVAEESPQDKTYRDALTLARDSLSAFVNAQAVAVPELSSRIEELRRLLPKAEEALGKPENRIPEIIKRLALGIVIATFFLALLRYMGGLYRIRYQQVVAAEHDDFMVRRFYIAFKGSAPSDEQRKTILSTFMTAASVSAGADGKDSPGDGGKEYEILKELLGALSKKL